MGKKSDRARKNFVIYLILGLIAVIGLSCFFYGSVLLSSIAATEDLSEFSTAARKTVNLTYLVPQTIPICDMAHSELIPCLDRNLIYELKLKVNLSVMEHYERHCPLQERRFNCLIPPPIGYKIPIRWPESRDEVWKANIPHTHLASEKSDQNWMVVNGDKINFPGGGTHFHYGADKYIVSLARMLRFPNDKLNNRGNLRNVLDVGCGVASFGAYLLSHKIIAMSLAPNDVHENQIQFALERGIPSTLGVLGTKRLPYPSRSFELAHCSRCRIDWLQRDGILLLEIDRLLRPGGYFAYSSPEAYASDPKNARIGNAMHDLFGRMCWRVAAKRDQTVIWAKPSSNACYTKREASAKPPLCPVDMNPDSAGNVEMAPCIFPYTEKVHRGRGSGLAPWPERVRSPPPRLEEVGMSAEEFREDTRVWRGRVDEYWKQMKAVVRKGYFRNVMDMNANVGGFAAALNDLDLWVMNVVPLKMYDRLKIVYDRGLIGTLHDWCESFSTYPRTYDLIHAWEIFSKVEEEGCGVEDLMMEVDRVLRPDGFLIIRDAPFMVDYIAKFAAPFKWDRWSLHFQPLNDSLSFQPQTVLILRKTLWTYQRS